MSTTPPQLSLLSIRNTNLFSNHFLVERLPRETASASEREPASGEAARVVVTGNRVDAVCQPQRRRRLLSMAMKIPTLSTLRGSDLFLST